MFRPIMYAASLVALSGTLILSVSGCSGKIVNQGEKVGSVIKISRQGFWIPTDEVEIVRGGMSNGSGAFSTTPLHATVNDSGIKAKLQDAFDKQYEVVVKYDDYYCYTNNSSESGCVFITSVKPLR